MQLHQGPPMKVQFRNIRIKELKTSSIDTLPKPNSQGKKTEVDQVQVKKK